ncbi:hypothetical protein HF292_000880 [Acidithiobacillus ferruginosus]|uniref:Uncharacterized protein n=1 Tax=Acidithiobacillus ferruginosus TaxID=3063951 RepID=A0ACD5IMQ6_9PROT
MSAHVDVRSWPILLLPKLGGKVQLRCPAAVEPWWSAADWKRTYE